jgi:hypothetical protein
LTTDDVQNMQWYRYLTLHVHDLELISFFLGRFACKRLCQIHLRCDTSFFSTISQFCSWGFFYRGGMDIIFRI